MINRIKHFLKVFAFWLTPKNDCDSCCLTCKYHDECMSYYDELDNE